MRTGLAARIGSTSYPSPSRKEKMSRNYEALRLWAMVLVVVGVAGVIFVVIGTIFTVLAAPTFWQGVGVPPDRWPSGRTIRQLADRSGAGLEGARRRGRVRQGPAEQGRVRRAAGVDSTQRTIVG